jgi:hypothetical protein
VLTSTLDDPHFALSGDSDFASLISPLGTLPGGSSSYATAINDRGDIVGYGGLNGFGPPFREVTQGFLWRGGSMRPVGALYCPCTFNVRYGTSSAFAVSASSSSYDCSGVVSLTSSTLSN